MLTNVEQRATIAAFLYVTWPLYPMFVQLVAIIDKRNGDVFAKDRTLCDYTTNDSSANSTLFSADIMADGALIPSAVVVLFYALVNELFWTGFIVKFFLAQIGLAHSCMRLFLVAHLQGCSLPVLSTNFYFFCARYASGRSLCAPMDDFERAIFACVLLPWLILACYSTVHGHLAHFRFIRLKWQWRQSPWGRDFWPNFNMTFFRRPSDRILSYAFECEVVLVFVFTYRGPDNDDDGNPAVFGIGVFMLLFLLKLQSLLRCWNCLVHYNDQKPDDSVQHCRVVADDGDEKRFNLDARYCLVSNRLCQAFSSAAWQSGPFPWYADVTTLASFDQVPMWARNKLSGDEIMA